MPIVFGNRDQNRLEGDFGLTKIYCPLQKDAIAIAQAEEL